MGQEATASQHWVVIGVPLKGLDMLLASDYQDTTLHIS